LNKFTDFSVEFRQLLLVKSDDFETDRSSLVDHVGSRDDLFREYGIQPSFRVGDEWQAIPGLRSKCIESFLRFFSTYYQENNVLLFRESVGDLLKKFRTVILGLSTTREVQLGSKPQVRKARQHV
jgi:hypothetical protein